jgi:pimeloyl-ACP methyl ester carboxylesterase
MAISQDRSATTTTPTNFVLVHGAWHGGWCWRRVADRLTARGHRVFTPTLTGLADRSHLRDAGIDLTTHITDIVNLIAWEDLDRVVLCGHSYGGMVVTGVADKIADRIASLVYLDAFVPENGQAMRDIVTRPLGDAPLIAPIPAAVFKVNAADQAYVDGKCTPHPAATMSEKLALTGAYKTVPKRSFIWASDYAGAATRFYEQYKSDPNWTVHAVACGHDVMLDKPDELAALLEAAA